jgi:hypothetical protein
MKTRRRARRAGTRFKTSTMESSWAGGPSPARRRKLMPPARPGPHPLNEPAANTRRYYDRRPNMGHNRLVTRAIESTARATQERRSEDTFLPPRGDSFSSPRMPSRCGNSAAVSTAGTAGPKSSMASALRKQRVRTDASCCVRPTHAHGRRLRTRCARVPRARQLWRQARSARAFVRAVLSGGQDARPQPQGLGLGLGVAEAVGGAARWRAARPQRRPRQGRGVRDSATPFAEPPSSRATSTASVSCPPRAQPPLRDRAVPGKRRT